MTEDGSRERYTFPTYDLHEPLVDLAKANRPAPTDATAGSFDRDFRRFAGVRRRVAA